MSVHLMDHDSDVLSILSLVVCLQVSIHNLIICDDIYYYYFIIIFRYSYCCTLIVTYI